MTRLDEVTDCLINRAMDVQTRANDGTLSLAAVAAAKTQCEGYMRMLDREAAELSERVQEAVRGA